MANTICKNCGHEIVNRNNKFKHKRFFFQKITDKKSICSGIENKFCGCTNPEPKEVNKSKIIPPTKVGGF